MALLGHVLRKTHKAQIRRPRMIANLRCSRAPFLKASRSHHLRSYGTKVHSISTQKGQAVWSVAVRDRVMVARTFHLDNLSSNGNAPAAGSTLIVDAVFSGSKLQTNANYLLDICAAQQILNDVLAEYNYRSLDIVFPSPTDPGRRNLEGLAKTIWERIVSQIADFELITSLRIDLQDPGATVTFESPISRVSPAVTSVSVRDRFQLVGPLKLEFGFDVEATLTASGVSNGDVLDYRLLKDTMNNVKGNLLPTILNNTTPLARSIWMEIARMLIKRGADKEYHMKMRVVEADGSNTFWNQPLSTISQQSDTGSWGVEVSEGCRVTHSFEGECFGTAQGSHGTTFEFSIVFDVGDKISEFDRAGATRAVSKVLSEYNQKDLDKFQEFSGCNTTCEHMAKIVWEKVRLSFPESQQDIVSNCRVRIRESDVAFVDYEGKFVKEASKLSKATTQIKSGEIRTNCKVLSFVAPSKVDVKLRNLSPEQMLLPNQIEIESMFSLVSTGTELRAFKGTFKEGEPLDTNFYDSKLWTYPMEYGYSLVGKVILAGSEVPEDMIGKTVFCFLPHASSAIEDWRNVHVIPSGISPEDATFLPAVETALSIVHDAHPLAMDTICVFGQGLVGRLVTWLLNKMNPLGRLVVVDPCESRRVEGIRMGAHEAFLSGCEGEKFDVCIEVSGNSMALQECLNSTRNSGKVVVASWYSEKEPIPLLVGTDFHRSQMSIVSSQVSQIPGKVADRWSKERRFDACWDLIKQLEPSKRIPVDVVPLEQAQEAFERLANRDTSCIQFSYNQNNLRGTRATVGSLRGQQSAKREGGTNHGQVEFISKAMLPTSFGTFDTRVFNIKNKDELCVVLLVGEIGKETKEVFMRLHDSCFTSEVLGSCKCDCKHQLEKAQKLIQNLVTSDYQSQILSDQQIVLNGTDEKQGSQTVGAIIYTFQEGRGIGLGAKMAAYDLQERLGYDTVTANEKLGLPVENREYSFVPPILESLGLDLKRVGPLGKSDNRVNIRLLTSNPYKVNALKDLGITTTLNPHIADIDHKSMAAAYVNVKAEKMGHVVSKDAFLKPQPLKNEKIIDEVTNKFKFELERFQTLTTAADLKSDLPFVTLSYAQSLDGTIGNAHPLHASKTISVKNGIMPSITTNGWNGSKARSRLILSGNSSMKMTHELRAKHDAILVGVGTVLTDDPRLTVRCGVSSARNPTPVILDSSLRTPLDSKLVAQARDCARENTSDSGFNLLILTTGASLDPSQPDYSPKKAKAFQNLTSIPGVRVVPIESVTSRENGGVPLVEAFQYLRTGCCFETVMVEGGATLIASMLKQPLVNHIVLTIVPSFVPGGVKVVASPHEQIEDRFDLVSRNTFKLGDDWVVTGNIKRSH